MASKTQPQAARGRPLFDVTCVIGSVFEGDGDLSPHEAAFVLIAQHDTEGTFHFPSESGGTVAVSVEYLDAPDRSEGKSLR